MDWTCIEGLRRNAPDLPPMAVTRIHVRRDLCPPESVIARWDGALNELIAQRSQVAAARIAQEIAAVALSRTEARAVEADPGAPALRTIRRYFDDADTLYQASVSVHPGDRFTYAMTLKGV
jgi:DNA-binding GntR family transcriptional regulator